MQIPWNMYGQRDIGFIAMSILSVKGYEDKIWSISGFDSIRDLNESLAHSGIGIRIDLRSSKYWPRTQNCEIWGMERLTTELAAALPNLYIWMALENNVEKEIFQLNRSMLYVFRDVGDDEPNPDFKLDLNPTLIQLLWNMKDQAVSWNRSLKAFQLFFESIDLSGIPKREVPDVVEGFLRSLDDLHQSSIVPLKEAFDELLRDHSLLFRRFCQQTRLRSMWPIFAQYKPVFLPGSFDTSEQEIKKITDIARVLAHCSGVMGSWAYMMEMTIDGLLSIALYGE